LSTAISIEEAKMCFACGPENPVGLQIRFVLAEGICTGEFRPTVNHVGYENTVHGGIIFSALDDVMANVLYLQNIKAHTARCEIRYRQALAVGNTIFLKGWIESQRKRLVLLKGEARLADGTLIADSEASFMTAKARPS
jgi:acyl-coenzyme A thioesterase PaaI-like protein